MLESFNLQHFQGLGISVTFSPHTAIERGVESKELEPKPDFVHIDKPNTQWHHPALWGRQGEPPVFPGKK